MVIVRDHLHDLLEAKGYSVKIDNQSIWENSSAPDHVDLIFQLIPAFKEEELNCPSIHIRPLSTNLNHPETLEKVYQIVAETYSPSEQS